MNTTISEHDQYVHKLEAYLEKFYTDVTTHQTITRRGDVIGEADIVAKRDGTLHIFEVKCSHRVKKARDQLKKLQQHYDEETKCYFYNGQGHFLIELDI